MMIAALLMVLSDLSGAETPREFAQRFCDSEGAFGRGVPDASFETRYDGLVGIEMIRYISAVNRTLARWRHRHRHSKENLMIPHIEANLFSGFSDGPTRFRVGQVTSVSGRTSVAVHREYEEGNAIDRWTDVLILDRDSTGWVVCDIETHHLGSLLSHLEDFRKSVESYR